MTPFAKKKKKKKKEKRKKGWAGRGQRLYIVFLYIVALKDDIFIRISHIFLIFKKQKTKQTKPKQTNKQATKQTITKLYK